MADLHILNGQDAGLCFELKEGANYIGRSPQNDIQIKDQTVSRRHLRILKKSGMYFLTDLESRNGTFVDGKCLIPGMEVEARKDVPVALGMTIIGIGGEACLQIRPFLDSVGLTKATGNNSGIFCVHKEKTNQKKLELVYKVNELLRRSLSKKETLELLLDIFFEVLVKVDRAAVVLIERGTHRIVQSVSKPKGDSDGTGFSEKIVARVLDERKPLIINDARKEERESELGATLDMEKITSVMCIPMMSFSDLVGVIYVDSKDKPYPFAQEDIFLFEDIAHRTAAFVLFEDLTEG